MLRVLADNRGQGMVEYGLILALIAVLLIGGIMALKGGLTSVFNRATNCMNSASQGQGC